MYNISIVLTNKEEEVIDEFFVDSHRSFIGAESIAGRYIKGKKDPRIDDMINRSSPSDMIEVWINNDDDPTTYYLFGRVK